MTAEEFTFMVAHNKGLGYKDLMDKGFVAVKCECGHSDCQGWQGRYQGIDWPEEGLSEPITAEMMGY